MIKRNWGFYILLTAVLAASVKANADADAVYEICNEFGECSSIDPTTGIIFTAISALNNELNSPHPFGDSNEIRKAIKELNKALSDGIGPNNDIVSFFDMTGINALLKNLGIQLFK